MSLYHLKHGRRVMYKIEAKDPDTGKWYEICARQPSIEKAAIKKYRYEKKGHEIRVIEQPA